MKFLLGLLSIAMVAVATTTVNNKVGVNLNASEIKNEKEMRVVVVDNLTEKLEITNTVLKEIKIVLENIKKGGM